MIQSVIQEEETGCGIASAANILGLTYAQMKAVANGMGIHASDPCLWSDTQYVRRLLAWGGVGAAPQETPFPVVGIPARCGVAGYQASSGRGGELLALGGIPS